MENENYSNTQNQYSSSEKKTDSVVWSIVAILVIALLGFLLFKNSNKSTVGENYQSSSIEDPSTQSDSSDLSSIEVDLENTDLNSLEVEIE